MKKTSTRATRLMRDAGTTTGAVSASRAPTLGGRPRVAGSDTSTGPEARRHTLTPAPMDPSNWLG